jgi:hypothetical protein
MHSGYSHGNVRERATIQSRADLHAWLTARQAPAAQPTDPTVAEGAQLFQTRGCTACKTTGGAPAQGKVGPN